MRILRNGLSNRPAVHELSFFVALDQLPASLKIFKRWEIVAGLTPRQIARSLQGMLSFAAIASNIRNRVSSPSAFDMFAIRFVSIAMTRVSVLSLPPVS